MGAWKPFSSDSRDNCKTIIKTKYVADKRNTNPNPENFNVLKQIVLNGYPIFLVNYPDANNYEGNKILMYPKFFNTELLKTKMDPHFFTKGDSPIARFEPTEFGWNLAQTLAKNSL